MAERKGFVLYGDIEETLNEMTDEEAAALFRGLVRYFNTGADPGFDGILKFVFIPIRQQMDRDREKYDAKCERNRAAAQKRWDANAYRCMQTYANDANTNKDTNKDKDTNKNKNKKADKTASVARATVASSAIQYLNEKTGGNYKTTASVVRNIGAIIDAGHTAEDIRAVIEKKCAEWIHEPKMRAYLRPSTLFGDKFEEYLAAPEPAAAEEERLEAEKKERARKAKEEQKRREEELDAKWLEENRERLEATRRKYGIGVQ